MTEAQAVEAILEAWDAGWTAAHPDVPSFYDNESGAAGTSFVRVTVIHTTSQQITMGAIGARRFQRNAQIFVQLFTPIDQGRATISGLADAARSVLEGQTLAGELVIDAGATRENQPDGTWMQMSVVLPCRYFETR